jgi:toxin ParE1/3/4
VAKVVWTQTAERWLLKIHDYIARDNPAAAFEVVESIYRRAQILADFPELGRPPQTPSGRQARILLLDKYRIAYLQCPGDEVHIVGVFHGAMDLDRYFR